MGDYHDIVCVCVWGGEGVTLCTLQVRDSDWEWCFHCCFSNVSKTFRQSICIAPCLTHTHTLPPLPSPPPPSPPLPSPPLRTSVASDARGGVWNGVRTLQLSARLPKSGQRTPHTCEGGGGHGEGVRVCVCVRGEGSTVRGECVCVRGRGAL